MLTVALLQMSGRHGKHRAVECHVCRRAVRRDRIREHLTTHKRPCKHCGELKQVDELLFHETLCTASVREYECNRQFAEPLECDGAHSVSGTFSTFPLPINQSSDYEYLIAQAIHEAHKLVKKVLLQHPIKAQIAIHLQFYKEPMGVRQYSDKVFRSICEPLLPGSDLVPFFVRVRRYVLARIR